MKNIINFLSSRINLTIFQCLMCAILGYVMYLKEFSWVEMGIVFITVFWIQFITRIKAVADGMMFRQMMEDNDWKVNDIVQKIKEEADRVRKKNNVR